MKSAGAQAEASQDGSALLVVALFLSQHGPATRFRVAQGWIEPIYESPEAAQFWSVGSIQLQVLCQCGSHHGAHVKGVFTAVCRVSPCGEHNLAEEKVHITLKVDHDALSNDSA
jgi:hypothetical protein